MPMTQLMICNAALARIGGAPVAALDSPSDTVALRCGELYPPSLEELLRLRRWEFAQAHAVLQPAASPVTPAFGFDHAFTLPEDCLRVHELNAVPASRHSPPAWVVEGAVLSTNGTVARVSYTRRVAEPALSATAMECLQLLLAARLALVLPLPGAGAGRAEQLRGEVLRVLASLEPGATGIASGASLVAVKDMSVAVCNAALSRLGEARVDDLFDNASEVASRCREHYPLALAEILRLHRWNFATARAVLPRVPEAVPPFGWSQAYALPSDCLRVLEVNGISGAGDAGAGWDIERGLLLTDAAEARIVYIRQEDDLLLWDALARECLVILLAAKLAPVLQGGSAGRAAELREELARMTAPLARRIDANESRRPEANAMQAMLAGSQTLKARRTGA